MKKTILVAMIATTLFACSAPTEKPAESSADDAAMADFKENSKVTVLIFEAFAKKDLNEWSKYNSDTMKAHGPMYGQEAAVGKDSLKIRLEGFHKLFNNIKPNDILLLPGVDTHIKFRFTNLQQKGFGLLSHLAKLPLFKNLKMGNRLRVREALLAPEGIIESDSLPGAHFYMVSRKFAKEVTSLNNPQYLSIDDFFSALSKMRAFRMGRTRKSFVSQLPFQSWTGSRFKAF